MKQIVFAVSLAAVMFACSPAGQQPTSSDQSTQPPATAAPAANDQQSMIRLAMSAAPADVSANAKIVEPGENGEMKEVRPGTNGWVCMAQPEVMCLDEQWLSFADAWMNKTDPQVTKIGFGYMLQGDQGGSNTDPFATAPTADNQWVVSPAHLMIVTPDVAQLNALSTDPNDGGPWVMWKGTKYAHIMVPIAAMSETGNK